MRKLLLLTLVLVAGFASRGQVLLSESFNSTTFPPTASGTWTVNTPSTNTNSFGPTGWARTASGGFASTGAIPTPATHSGAGMAGFNSYWVNSTGYSDLITPAINFTVAGTKALTYWVYYFDYYSIYFNDKIDVYINTTANLTGSPLLLETIYPSGGHIGDTGWHLRAPAIPASYTGATNYIIFRATSAYNVDEFIDDVTVLNIPPCSGTPSAGTAYTNSLGVCPGKPFTLYDTGFTVAGNMSYRWQSSPAGMNTWTNLAPAATALNSSYTVSAGISTATDYRFTDTCLASGGGGAVSNVLHITINPVTSCYCTPTYTYGCNTSPPVSDIYDIYFPGEFSTGINQLANPCPTPSTSYTNYSGLTCTILFTNKNYPFSINTQGYSNSSTVRAWIDFNDDGNFNNTNNSTTAPTGEAFAITGNYSLAVAPSLSTYTFNLPSNVNPGTHRMRVRVVYFQNNTPLQPCVNEYYGETRDYCVTILPQTPVPPTVTTNSPLCPYTTLSMTACTNPLYPNPSFTFFGPDPRLPITVPGNSSGCATMNLPAVQPGLTNYTVTVSSGGFTSNPATPAITIFGVPNLSASNVTAATSCPGSDGSFQLNGLTAGLTYTLLYRKDASSTTTSQSITANASGSYVVTGLSSGYYDSIRVITPAPQSCRSNIINVPVTISTPTPPATPAINYQSPICAGDTLKFTVTNPLSTGSYLWVGPTGFRSTTQNARRPLINFPDTGKYYVTVRNTTNNCLSAAAVASVTLANPDPAPTPINVPYCQFDVAQPLSAIGSNLLFYDSLNQPLKTGVAVKYPNTSVAGTFIYYVTQTINCESPRTPLYVLVKPRPPFPSTPSTTVQYCQYQQVGPLTATGTAVRWYATPTGGAGTATAPTAVTLVPGTFFFYATQTINGCESDRLIITVIVKPKPEPPTVVSPLNLCQFDPIQPLTAVGQNLLWYTVPNGGVGVPVAPLPNTGYEDSFKYFVTQTVNGCESDRALLNVIVNYKPNGIIAGTISSVCQDQNDTFNYYGNARPDAQYVWFAPLTTHILAGQGTQGPFVVRFDTFGVAVIRLTVNNKGCISQLLSAPITVRPLPVISFVKRQDVCKDQLLEVGLNAVSNNPVISGFNWNFNASGNAVDPNIIYGVPTTGGPFGVKYPEQGHYQISATATAGGCTSEPIYQDVYVHDLPDVTIHSDKPTTDLCAMDTLRLSVAQVPEGASYTWTPAAYFQSHIDTLNYYVDAVISQSSTVKVDIKTSYGCENTGTLDVMTKPCCGVYFPNAFAPNGNVIQNRTFKPITAGIHKVNTFKVLNRWGQVMYESKVERNGWDGTTNGVPQDMGTYFYFISYQCEGKTVEEHGEFLLLR